MQAFELRLRAQPARSCPVRVGRGALDRLVEDLVARPPGRPLVLISDSNVGPLYAEPLLQRVRDNGLEAHLEIFPAGELHKTRETKAALEDRLLDLGIGREAAIVAVGGGVTGDLAGFTAATWQRGIPVIHVPTTVLSMADAALGGKTAVDLPGGKNLVGAFHQPAAVYADVSTLTSLPEVEFRAGFAEVVKSAVIADIGLMRRLEGSVGPLLERRPDALEQVASDCLRIKGRVVARDEREEGRRAVLNFGHTVAHALEAASGYAIRHGHAVSVGMVVEARMATPATGFPVVHRSRLEKLLAGFGLPVRWPEAPGIEAVVAATHRDKKVRAGQVRYALPKRLGRMLPGHDVTLALEEEALRAAIRDLSLAGSSAAPGAD